MNRVDPAVSTVLDRVLALLADKTLLSLLALAMLVRLAAIIVWGSSAAYSGINARKAGK